MFKLPTGLLGIRILL